MRKYIISGNIVDVINSEIYKGTIKIKNGRIKNIERNDNILCENYILPGLIDADVHIESSLVAPSFFAAEAVKTWYHRCSSRSSRNSQRNGCERH